MSSEKLPDHLTLPQNIPHGDMPGDKININDEHIHKASVIFSALKQIIGPMKDKGTEHKLVMCVCGGSGVGKSEIASVLGYFFSLMGIGCYILSGDNYPHRIPRDNDSERLRLYRSAGLKALLQSGFYNQERMDVLRKLWQEETDASELHLIEHPWLKVYQQAGRKQLTGYLGTPNEIDFDELSGILHQYKSGSETIYLKRMGRVPTELWYDAVDMRGVSVMIVEWTHGNSNELHGVDIPIMLNSTPSETLAHRRTRNRDGKTDSAFTTMVLEIEQAKLKSQSKKAQIILSKQGELLSHEAYSLLMADEHPCDSYSDGS